MASKKRSGCIKALIIGSIVCFVILVLFAVWFFSGSWLGDMFDFGPRGGMEAVSFIFDYCPHALGADVTPADIDKWYSPEAPRPRKARVLTSPRSVADWESGTEAFPLQNIVISLNMADKLSEVDSSEDVGLWRRVSAPGDEPVFTYSWFEERAIEDEAAPGFPIGLRHDPDLEKGKVLLTFEIRGRDPDSGTLKRERHRVTFVEQPEHDEDEPSFLVVSHVVEPLPPEPAEAPDE